MPRADITGEYRSDAGQSRFPRLKLAEGEKARIVVVSSPVIEYVHRLEAPNIVNMAPTYKKIKNRDGQDQYVIETRFVSGPICHGSYEVLRERGFDDKSCQACSVARERPEIFRPPQPKYAVNVIRYGLRPGGGWNDIAAPYGVSAIIWVFGAKVMDKLIDIRSMGPAYEDIRQVDLLLECDDKNFQKPYSNGEFLPVTPAVWLSNDQTRQYTVAYLQANGASEEDLTAAIGKRVKQDWLADDISRVIQRWDVVRAYESRGQGGPSVGQPGFGGETLQQGMGQLQQQYGGVGGTVGQQFAPGGNGGYQPQATATSGYGAGSAGVDMGLMGGHFHQTPPSPPPPQGDYMAAAQQAGANGANPAAAAYTAATGVQLPPGTGQWQPPVPPTTPPSAPTVPGTAPQETAPGAPPTEAASPSSPPAGLSGLNEFMGSTTSNPSMEAQPSVPFGQLAPPSAAAAPAAAAPAGGTWSFDDLKRMADGQ
jgi:hypothetical protein